MAISASAVLTDLIAGLEALWAETLEESEICVAVLDGPVDQSHPVLVDARLTRIDTLNLNDVANKGSAAQHGTQVASIIFGKHCEAMKGIAPHCRGLFIGSAFL